MSAGGQAPAAPVGQTLAKSLKAQAKTLWSGWARLTAGARVLPDFLIIGTQRGGTTSLYNYLAGHPCVGRALTKELRYFDVGYHLGPRWYRSRFPTAANLAVRRWRHGGGMTGEASPDYLFYPHASARLASLLPGARQVVLLRDPVERAWSHWWHQVRRGHEDLSFDDAVAAEDSRLTAGLLDVTGAGVGSLTYHDHHHSYVTRGIYAPQLERWWRFVPREQTLVLRSEDLFEQPAAVFARVQAFIGLPPWERPSYDSFNGMASGAMSDTTRALLTDRFRPHNQRLEELLERPLGWDENPS